MVGETEDTKIAFLVKNGQQLTVGGSPNNDSSSRFPRIALAALECYSAFKFTEIPLAIPADTFVFALALSYSPRFCPASLSGNSDE